jgi:membrane protease YdiL (CAAX protease family)
MRSIELSTTTTHRCIATMAAVLMAAMVHILMQPVTNGRHGNVVETRIAIDVSSADFEALAWSSNAIGSPDSTECKPTAAGTSISPHESSSPKEAAWIFCRMIFRSNPYPTEGFHPIDYLQRARGWKVVASSSPSWTTGGMPWRVDWPDLIIGSTALLLIGLFAHRSQATASIALGFRTTIFWSLSAVYVGLIALGIAMQHELYGTLVQPGPRESTPQFLLLVLVIGPLIEELFYRGWMLSLLRRAWGDAPALLVSSGLFAIVHAWSETSILYAYGLGYILGTVMVKTRSLFACVVLHAALNLIPFLFELIEKNWR